MKKHLLLFTLLLTGFSGFSQQKLKTIGIMAGPFRYYDFMGQQYRFSYNAGITYDHQLSRRFGFNTGIQFTALKFESDFVGNCVNCADPILTQKIIFRDNFIEVPLNATFCLNPKDEAALKVYLYSGLVFNPLMFSKAELITNNESEVQKYPLTLNKHLWNSSKLNLGLEVRKALNEKYQVAATAGTWMQHSSGFNFSKDSGYPPMLYLTLKLGRNL
jgi:hypothetical protein